MTKWQNFIPKRFLYNFSLIICLIWLFFVLHIFGNSLIRADSFTDDRRETIVSLKRIIKEIHKDSINDVEYDPIHNYFITASDDYTVGIFDFDSGDKINYIQEFYNDVRDITFNPDYSLIATADNDGYLNIYKYPEIVILKSIYAHNDSVSSVEFSPDGTKLISAGDDGAIKIWDTEDNFNNLMILEAHQDFITKISIDKNFKYIVSASEDNSIRVYNNEQKQFTHILIGHIDYVKAVDISSDGSYIVSGDDSGKIILWDTKSGEKLYELNYHKDYIRSVYISPDGQSFVVSSDDRSVSLWELPTGKLITLYTGFSDWVFDAKIIRNGDFIIAVNDNREAVILPLSELGYYIAYTNRNFITYYKYRDESYGNKYIRRLDTLSLQDKSGISKIQHHTKTHKIAVSYFSGYIELFHINKINHMNLLNRFKAHSSNISHLKISNDGKYLVSASINGQIKVWGMDGKHKHTISNASYISELHISIDSKYLLISDLNAEISLINIETGELIAKKMLQSLATSIVMDEQQRFLFIGYTNNKSELWTYPEMKRVSVIHTDSPVSSAVIHNNQIVISSLNGDVKLFNFQKTSLGRIVIKKVYHCVIFDKLAQMRVIEGKNGITYIVSLSDSRNIIFWKLNQYKCKPVSKVSASSKTSWNTAFSIDDTYITAGSGESIIKIYKINF